VPWAKDLAWISFVVNGFARPPINVSRRAARTTYSETDRAGITNPTRPRLPSCSKSRGDSPCPRFAHSRRGTANRLASPPSIKDHRRDRGTAGTTNHDHFQTQQTRLRRAIATAAPTGSPAAGMINNSPPNELLVRGEKFSYCNKTPTPRTRSPKRTSPSTLAADFVKTRLPERQNSTMIGSDAI